MRHETKQLFRVALLFLSCFVAGTRLIACDVCGCFIGILPYDNQSSIGMMHRYRIFNGYPAAPAGHIFPAGAYRLSTPPSVLHGGHSTALSSDDFESYKIIELRAKWFVHPRIELNFIFPFAENRSKTNAVAEKINGLGDPTFLAGFHLIKSTDDREFRHRLVAGVGIKFPVGTCAALSANGDRLPVMMELGTGSTDGIAYLAYTGGGHNFRWGNTFSGKLNGTNKYGEQFAPSVSNTSFVGYLLTKGQWRFLPQCSSYSEYMNGLRHDAQLQPGTAMKAVLVGPGIDVFYKNLSLSCGMQFPVYEEQFASNLLNKGKLQIGMSWNFNQQRYLIQPKKTNFN